MRLRRLLREAVDELHAVRDAPLLHKGEAAERAIAAALTLLTEIVERIEHLEAPDHATD